jgi:hypothetical protein
VEGCYEQILRRSPLGKRDRPCACRRQINTDDVFGYTGLFDKRTRPPTLKTVVIAWQREDHENERILAMRATLCAIVFASVSLVLCEQAETQSAGNLNALRGLAPLSVLTASDRQGGARQQSFYHRGYPGRHAIPADPAALAEQQQLALRDAFITDGNAYELADGLGSTLGGIYLSLTSYQSTDDGKTFHFTNISPAVAQLIAYANATARSDSSSAKYFFGNGTTDKGDAGLSHRYDDPDGNQRPHRRLWAGLWPSSRQ